ncbi:MAG: nucleotidyltransferase family protein [Novosphingobium sp.]
MQTSENRGAVLTWELRPEARLILYCARTEISPAVADEIKALTKLPLDWDFVCNSADKHRVTQLLFRNLSAICPQAMPADIKARLRHQFHGNGGLSLKLARALVDLYPAFEASEIPVIPYKGSILAEGTYGKLAFRQNYDVDLFIRQEDIAASHRLFLEQGYACDEVFDREARYRHSETGVEVDLHWGFTPRYFHVTFDFDELYARARTVSLMDQRLVTFSAEDFLEILCLQVMKDCWERQQQLEHLSKVCDIAEHLRANPDLDWPAIQKSMKNKGLMRIMHCALMLAKELLQARIPPEVERAIERDRSIRKRVRWMCRALFSGDDKLSPLETPSFSLGLRLRQLRFYMGIRERYRERIRHLGEILMISRANEALSNEMSPTEAARKKGT